MGRLYQFAKQTVGNYCNRLDDNVIKCLFDDENRKQRIGLILGTGWSNPDVLKNEGFVCEHKIAFPSLGLNAKSGAGHPNMFLFGTWHGRDVVISQGRFHLYQDRGFPEGESLIRRWMSYLIYFMNGGKQLVVTSAVGGLSERMKEDKLVMPTGIISAHLPMPYFFGSEGEFGNGEPLILMTHNHVRQEVFQKAAQQAKCFHELNGIHHVIPGPGFGSGTERKIWAGWGYDTVGESLDPELRLVWIESMDNRPQGVKGAYHETDIRVLATLFVTDAHDIPDNDEIQARAKAMAPNFGKFLSHAIQAEW